MGKSFYDPDYIIELGEKRVEQYASAYHLTVAQVAYLVIIYTGFGIYIIPIIQDLLYVSFGLFSIAAITFFACLGISCVYALRLMFPSGVVELMTTHTYQIQERGKFEKELLNESMAPWEREEKKKIIDELVKDAYLGELDFAQRESMKSFQRKKYCYQTALVWALFAIVPYLISLFYHIILKK